MKLSVNFNSLHGKVERMGAAERDFNIDLQLPTLDPIDAQLEVGIDVEIKDIEILSNGLLSYKDRQVLLYIQDQGWRITEAIEDGATGRKYHVAYCRTLDEMEAKGRYDRYVAKNDISGYFFVDGTNRDTDAYEDGEAQLNVCKNCLKKVNYLGFDNENSAGKRQIFENFSCEEFFEQYKQFFKHKPKFQAGKIRSSYTDDWIQVSQDYRQSQNWVCEECAVSCINDKLLLHTHHKNGVKGDNSLSNLKSLCVECHLKEPDHSHMHRNDGQLQKLRKIRDEQS